MEAGATVRRSLPPPPEDLVLKGFRLRDDLARLERIGPRDAPEAAIFYCARILEAVAATAVLAMTGETPGNAWSSLRRLGDLGVLSSSRKAYFHALRRLGNTVRHMERTVGASDADVALALLVRFLAWHGSVVRGAPDPAEITSSDESELDRTLALLDRSPPDLQSVERLWRDGGGEAFGATPVVAALFAEHLVAAGPPHDELSLQVIDRAMGSFADDARLLQLRALALRRLATRANATAARALEHEAEQILQALETNDPETAGLLAALHKDRWRAAPDTRRGKQSLCEAARLYGKAWLDSRETDTYTGINAAATALLSGRPEDARAIAGRIVALYEARRGRLAPGHAIAFSDYFDRVTLAEAELLLDRVDDARRHYRAAMQVHAGERGSIRSTTRQLELLLPALGLPHGVEAFLSPEGAPPTPGDTMTTYTPKPMDTSSAALPADLEELVERLAEHVHDVWAAGRIAAGWTYGPKRDDAAKTHPDLVPYDQLPEGEKDYDRRSARDTLKAVLAMGYRIGR